jgi:hypothetical protein
VNAVDTDQIWATTTGKVVLNGILQDTSSTKRLLVNSLVNFIILLVIAPSQSLKSGKRHTTTFTRNTLVLSRQVSDISTIGHVITGYELRARKYNKGIA